MGMDTNTAATTIHTANGTIRLFADVEVIGGQHKGMHGKVTGFGTGAEVGLVYVEGPARFIHSIEGVNVTSLDSYDPASDTWMDPGAPVVICDKHTARDIDPMSGRCWECGERVAIGA